jgi:hypothetical protein
MEEKKIDQVDGAVVAQNEYRYSVDESGRRLSVTGRRVSIVDDVFGEIVEGGPNYRNVSVSHTAYRLSQTDNPFRSAG